MPGKSNGTNVRPALGQHCGNCVAALGQYPEPHWARPTQYTVQSQFTVEFHLSFDNRLTGALTRLGAVLLLLVGNVRRGLGALFCTLRGAN